MAQKNSAKEQALELQKNKESLPSTTPRME